MTIILNNKLPKTVLIFILVFFLVGFVAFPLAPEVKAQTATVDAPSEGTDTSSGGKDDGEKVPLTNPLTGKTENISPYILVGRLVYVFLAFVGVASLLFFVYGGFQWLISAGNPEKVKKGRDTLIWAMVGVLVTLASYGILKLVISTLRGS